jgi:hypothetical protein
MWFANVYMAIISTVQKVVSYAKQLEARIKELLESGAASASTIAELRANLATALANDVADAEAIAAAKADAEAALALAAEAQATAAAANLKVSELEALLAEDAAEDAEVKMLVDALVPVEEG